ncbi:MAG: hypothetical protein EXR51_06075 [Dehalococcoidia bacterium]|nr:hypothetical protein [Dehalococcoidia bacterium]
MQSQFTGEGEEPTTSGNVPSDPGQAAAGDGVTPAGQPDDRVWAEPHVAAKAIFTELFRAGGKNENELEQLLGAHATTMGWAVYWAKEGFLTQVADSRGKTFQLSNRAVMELELG